MNITREQYDKANAEAAEKNMVERVAMAIGETKVTPTYTINDEFESDKLLLEAAQNAIAAMSQPIKQEEVAEDKIKDILEDGLLWIKEMREGVNKWSEGHCGLDSRMQNLEEWGKEVRVLLYQGYRITKRGEK